MNSVVLLVIFLIVWFSIAGYLFSLDRKVKQLKRMLNSREKS
jgi:CcmD family protein